MSEVWAHLVQPSLGCTAATPPPYTRVVDVSDEPRCRCGNVMEWRGADWFCADCATARQRAEAFLRTLGKWEEPVVKDSLTTDGDLLRDATKKVGEKQP